MPDRKITPAQLVALADEIDQRVGPIPGRKADEIAVALRAAADCIAGVRHPTGSEAFGSILDHLGAPAPWRLCEVSTGEVLSADGRPVCDADTRVSDSESIALALWIICAINTLAGFNAETPLPPARRRSDA